MLFYNSDSDYVKKYFYTNVIILFKEILTFKRYTSRI